MTLTEGGGSPDFELNMQDSQGRCVPFLSSSGCEQGGGGRELDVARWVIA